MEACTSGPGTASRRLTPVTRRAARWPLFFLAIAALWLAPEQALAQTYGIATMHRGTLSYRTGAAIAKVVHEKAGLNILVQPMAGETVLLPVVAKGEAQFGLANIIEYLNATTGQGGVKLSGLRLIGPIHTLQITIFARKGGGITTIAELKGKRVPMGYATFKTTRMIRTAMLATANLTLDDIDSVPVSGLIQGANAFVAGDVDAFTFAFGAPKLREVNAAVGGIQALKIEDTPAAIAASRKVFPYGYLTEVKPGFIYIGVERPMKVYSIDLMLFTNASVKDEVVYKVIEAMVANKADLLIYAPHLRAFSAKRLHKKYGLAYHPGALKYFADHKIAPKAIQ